MLTELSSAHPQFFTLTILFIVSCVMVIVGLFDSRMLLIIGSIGPVACQATFLVLGGALEHRDTVHDNTVGRSKDCFQ